MIQTLAQFEVLEELGEGEWGMVYRARDSSQNREVEIEILPPAKGAIDIDRLRQEVNAARALEHWSIAKTYDLAQSGDTTFLAREHAPGHKLAGPLGFPAALECARQIAGALGAGHSIGVTHRHLNPGNIILTGENAVKLVNFGLTPLRRDERYLAPEQLDGRGADARGDIYAFGLVLREIAGPAAPKPIERIIARCIQKNASRRYQLMEEIQQALDQPPQAQPARRLWLGVGAAALIIVALAWWMLGSRASVDRGPVRLTADSGLTTEAAISPDGRLIAYASDRISAGVLHIWKQPVSGGSPMRLTDGPDDDHQPAVSPDDARIVFRSERAGGGIYVVPAAGGSPQLLVKGGRGPRFSPDARWIAYWSGDPLSANGASVWVIASSGGTPHQIHPEFLDVRFPVWSPDGKYLLFVVHVSEQNWRRDWYVAAISEGTSTGEVIRTGAETLLHMQAVRESPDGYSSGSYAIPEAWSRGQVLFSARMPAMGPRSSGPPHLLRIPINPTILEATGAAHEITSGPEWDLHPSAATTGRLVFSRRAAKAQIWSVAPDGSGDLRRLTEDAGDVHPSVSLDGKRLAYRFHAAAARDEIRVIDLETGQPIARIEANLDPDVWPLISPAGDQVVYSAGGLFRKRLPDGELASARRRHWPWDRVTSWSADGKRLLIQRNRNSYGLLDVETGEDREFLRSGRFPIIEAHFSPDAKWVVFTVASRPHSQIFLTPALDGAETSWIEVTADDVSSGSPAWSADGNQIYYITQCQGFRCIWARRIDPRRKQPIGPPFPFRHFHNARWSLLAGADLRNVGVAAARDKLVFGMFETTGNIWSLPAIPKQ